MFSKLSFHILLYVKWPCRRRPLPIKNVPLYSWYLRKKRKLVKFPIIHLTTDSLKKKYIWWFCNRRNARLWYLHAEECRIEINVNSDRRQVSSICKKVKERIWLLVRLCAVSFSPAPRLLEPMLLITWKFLRVMQNLGGMINNSNGQRCCCWESTTAMTSFCGWF